MTAVLSLENIKRVMVKFFLAAASMVFAGVQMDVALADDVRADNNGTWSFQIENDRIANTDRHYTNGFRFSYVSNLESDGPMWVRKLLDLLYPVAEIHGGRFGAAFGQNIYTPADTDAVALVPDDRPYAGWLYGAVSLHAETTQDVAALTWDVLDTVEFNFGVIGPYAFGEEVQNTYHGLIGVSRSNGWDNQLDNEPALALFAERKWRRQIGRHLGFDIDAIPHAGVALGNVAVSANLGLTIRVGRGLKMDFGPPHIRPTLSGLEAVKPDRDFSWYFFATGEGRAVAHDIFLDGNTFTDSHNVDRRAFVGDVQFGVVAQYHDVRMSFTHVYRSREFDGQSSADRFGAFSISVNF